MKQLLFIIALLFGAAMLTEAQVNPNHVYVNGYYRSNGTYVQGHYRTAPNHTINDNFSTYPNVNPYTGKVGTIKPDYYNSFSNSGFNSYYPSYTPTPSYSPKSVDFYNLDFFKSSW